MFVKDAPDGKEEVMKQMFIFDVTIQTLFKSKHESVGEIQRYKAQQNYR